jgi:hypothetical protein
MPAVQDTHDIATLKRILEEIEAEILVERNMADAKLVVVRRKLDAIRELQPMGERA